MTKSRSSVFHWLSFLPALAYWWLEETQPLHIALSVGMGLAVLEIVIEKIYSGKVHTLSRLNFGIIVFLGAISLVAHEGIWFKLQPTITGVVIGSWLLFNQVKGQSILLEAMEDMGRPWPFAPELMKGFERDVTLFIFSYATFMAYWSIWGTTSQWAFWKTGGQYICFGLFMLFEMLLMRRKLRKGIK